MRPLIVVFVLTFVGACGNRQPLAGPSLLPSNPLPTISVGPFSPISVVAVGDIANCSTELTRVGGRRAHELVADLIARNLPRYLLLLGDNQYPDGSKEQYMNCYEPSFGQFMGLTYPIPGNHEYRTPGAIGYFQYFRERGRVGANSYYSFDPDNYWHVIMLGSDLANDLGQKAFFENDLQANRRSCIIAAWHYVVHSSGNSNGNAEMIPYMRRLHEARATLVLEGHDHGYEDFYLQSADAEPDEEKGLHEIVIGTGGAEKLRPTTLKRNSRRFNNDTFGVLKLTLNGPRYDYQFLSIDNGFSDIGSGICH